MRRCLLALIAVAALVVNANAQNPPPGRVEASGGVTWIGGTTLGSSDATETTPTGGTSRIFSTSSELGRSAGFGGRIDVRITRRVEAGVVGSYTKPAVRTTISSDIENSTIVTATETIKQYTIGAGGLLYLPAAIDSGLRLFVAGTAAYMRQLHENDTLAVTGQLYQGGGGVKYFFPARQRSWLKAYGIRGDVALAARVKGVSFDNRTKYSPTLSLSLSARF
jgi:hypothetical protein